jgi:predicted MFS family arabinose efflux permease
MVGAVGARRTPQPRERPSGHPGVFNALYGVDWFAGSVLLGALHDRSVLAVVAASLLLQAASLPPLLWLVRSNRWRGAGTGAGDGS